MAEQHENNFGARPSTLPPGDYYMYPHTTTKVPIERTDPPTTPHSAPNHLKIMSTPIVALTFNTYT